MGSECVTIKDIIYQARIKNRHINKREIIKAYRYAEEKHRNQLRKSGEKYIIHPLYVAYILANLGLDTQTICAALLHDVVEDTNVTYQEIEENFGEEIAQIVEGVTKLSDTFKTLEERQTENYKKMFIAMEKDIRVIILKLADRLHNIMTLKYLKRDRQIAIAKETLELYAPIAHKLGMYNLKLKLQEGAFKYIYPKQYKEISEKIVEIRSKNNENIKQIKEDIEKELKKQGIFAILRIEIKNKYNIYKKMKEKNIEIEEIKDLFAIKIITKEKMECYKVLGIVNAMYKIFPKTFKDYIATPRNNLYQAIQEVLVGEEGIIFEVQICSYVMNKIAENGIINYFSYIENYQNLKNELKENLIGIYNSIDLEKTIDNPKEFLKTLKTEILDEEVYVFTPKGEIKSLPKGSIAIDFAYLIHDDIGNHIKACKINNKQEPITTKLENGNIVEIITQDQEAKFTKEEVKNIKTAKAKKQLYKKQCF